MSGKIFIASMNMRGKWAEKPDIDNLHILNVTSAQAKTNANRLAFSPMTPVEGGYKGFWNFESYWQSGKVFENITEEKVKKFWINCKEAKRRYPNSKGKKVLYAKFYDDLEGQKLDYIESRKKVYVPEYYKLIQNKDQLQYWKNLYKKGENIIIYDFDGPRKENGEVECLEFNEELFKEKLEYTNHPFGHGYIVAAAIMDLKL